MHTHKEVWAHDPRKMLDFRSSEIVSDAFSEYRAKIPQIMQTAHLALELYTLASVVP